MPCPEPGARPLPAWPELGLSAAGVKEAGGLLAGSGKEAVLLARQRHGGGSWASSALAQLLPAVALGPALLPVPAPHLKAPHTRLTHALLSATSFSPATAAPLSLPTTLSRELRHHPTRGLLCWKGECGVCVCCWAVLMGAVRIPEQGVNEGRRGSALLVTCLWARLAPQANLSVPHSDVFEMSAGMGMSGVRLSTL